MDLSERRTGQPRRHPWELARASFVHTLMRQHGVTSRALTWLDVGAGDGWLGTQIAALLHPKSHVTCWDAFYTDDDLATLRDTVDDASAAVEFTSAQPTATFDAISLFDVVEHVADDHAFLTDVLDRNLAEGGIVFVTVPAHPALFSSHDVALHHYRRYRPRECRDLLERCGLVVDADGGLFASLLAPRAAAVAVERMRHVRHRTGEDAGVGGWTGGPAITRLVTTALEVDNRLAQACARRTNRYPGLSYWAVARR